MAKTFEQRVQATRDAACDPSSPAHRAHLLKTFAGTRGYLISVAAGALGGGDSEFVAAARAAFVRLLDDPIKRDPQCHGKVAIAKAFYEGEQAADDVFVAGAAHVQLEPVLGGRQDTAAELRGISLMGLVHRQHPRALPTAAALLVDPERAARLAAIRALGSCGRPDIAEPLLRLKFEGGDEDGEVLMDCITELLRIEPAENLPIVADRVGAKDLTLAQSAALAIGASRPPGALAVLVSCADQSVTRERRETILLAIAMLKSDAAVQHLIELVIDGAPGEASDAVRALATLRHQAPLVERVRLAVEDRGDAEIGAQFADDFATAEGP